MKEKEEKEVLLGRRRTLQMFGIGIAAGGAVLVAACKKDAPPPSGDNGTPVDSNGRMDCSQDIDEGSKTLRRNLQYKARAAVPEKHCSACAQFIPNKYAACGGGCKLIPGPVKPEGGCLSFAPIGADAAPPT